MRNPFGTPIVHNDYCIKLQLQAAEYVKQWPNHCPKCHGRGYLTVGGDAVEYWGTMTHLPDTQESCDACIQRDICPRCGARGTIPWNEFTDEFDLCGVCGYEYEVTDGQPDVECECWMPVSER